MLHLIITLCLAIDGTIRFLPSGLLQLPENHKPLFPVQCLLILFQNPF